MGAAASTECGTTAQQVRSTVLNGKPLDASDIQVSSIDIKIEVCLSYFLHFSHRAFLK